MSVWSASLGRRPTSPWVWIWCGLLAATALLFFAADHLPWAVDYPKGWTLPVAKAIGMLMTWLKNNFTEATRGFAALVGLPLDGAFILLAKGSKTLGLPPLSWIAVVGIVALCGLALGGRWLALGAGACFLYVALFGQWESAMLTLALIAICVPYCVATGVIFGILAYRNPRLDKLIITPLLDLMQTMPTFAYLVPMLLLFGNNPVSAMLATGIFATPPMVRATVLALQRVAPEIDDFGTMVGCSRQQKLWRVLMPSARPTLLVGLNQVIMLSLNMVIISSMIGAGGLGYDVLLALRALNVGSAMDAGLAIVVLAVALDRLSHAAAIRKAELPPTGAAFWQRHPYLVAGLGLTILATAASLIWPALAVLPDAATLSTGSVWKASVDWINQNFFDDIDAARTVVTLYVMNPVRDFMVAFPWTAAVVLLAVAGYRLGGWRLALLAGGLTYFCAAVGLWEKTMLTIYLCGISTIFAALIGIPIGVWAARSDAVERVVTPIIDTLQTLPSFCFIIPAVMLLRVSDVTSMIAIVSFAVVPAIRYTNHGLRQVPPALIEAAKVSGCSKSQLFWRVQLPLALPEIMLGINQTILFALSMLVITALIGSRDLGQEVFIALAKADSGRGIVAGLCIAFIGIVADRLIGAWTRQRRQRLGLAS